MKNDFRYSLHALCAGGLAAALGLFLGWHP